MAKDYNDIPLIKERLKKLLKEKGISQKYLAEEFLHIDKDYFNSCIRKGHTNQKTLIEIGKTLDCSPYYLCDESVSYLPFASYERWSFDIDDCLKGFLYTNQYDPKSYSSGELLELKTLICKLIDDYSIGKNKPQYDLAFWSTKSSEPVATITLDQSQKDNKKRKENTNNGINNRNTRKKG